MPTNFAFTSTRKFGVEIEGCGISREQAAEALRGAGLMAQTERYNHNVRPHWKVVEDRSVQGGFEVVSPVLQGDEGLADVAKAANALIAAGAKVDRRCGLHVHVDARDLSAATILNAVKRYVRHEAQIDAVVPVARRNNSYAQGMAPMLEVLENLERDASGGLANLTPGMLANAAWDRYRKLNLQSFLTHGTLEFRQHSGTVDAAKIVNWIVFCVTFVEDSKVLPVLVPAAPVASVTGAQRERTNAIGRKFSKLLELLRRSNRYSYLTPERIAVELEISLSSVPSYVSQFRDRYPMVTVEARRGHGYFSQDAINAPAEAPAASVPAVQAAPVTSYQPQVDRGIFANLPIPVQSFFAEREMELSSAGQ